MPQPPDNLAKPATPNTTNNLVVFISGNGSNLAAILQTALAPAVRAVFSDNPNAAGLAIAQQHQKNSHVFSKTNYNSKMAWEADMHQTLQQYQPCLIALAGFMSILSGQFIQQQQHNIVNIHPSLLPDFKGRDTHQRVLNSGAKQHGCTVHWLSPAVDAGTIIAQSSLTVHATDTASTLQKRVQQLEHRLYPSVLKKLLQQGKP